MKQKLTLQDLSLKNQRALVRVDFNVPLNPAGEIADDTRIKEVLPTIDYIAKAGGKIILMSHLGRPKGKRDPQFSLAVCAKRLSELLGRAVRFAPDCIGPEVEMMAAALQPGELLLLENLRFYAAEEKPLLDPTFAESLAKLGDLFINDAFGAAHREHSSTATIARFFPGKAAAGLLLQKEIAFLGNLAMEPRHPFYALVGGSKISTKMGVLKSLLEKVDGMFVGGGMAYTFFKAQGLSIGDSIFEEAQIEEARAFLQLSTQRKVALHLPVDIVIADRFSNEAEARVVLAKEGIPAGWQGVDIGPKTREAWSAALQNAATIFWNGPFGVFEFPRFAEGTNAIAKTLATLKKATTVVGGGDSVSAVNNLGLAKEFSHVSTGGGASLELIELGHLPGIDSLSSAK
jgi:phosphoglycerate kinase